MDHEDRSDQSPEPRVRKEYRAPTLARIEVGRGAASGGLCTSMFEHSASTPNRSMYCQS